MSTEKNIILNSPIVTPKLLEQRNEFEKIIEKLIKQNDLLVKMNNKNIKLIHLQNERISRINKKILVVRWHLINDWSKGLNSEKK